MPFSPERVRILHLTSFGACSAKNPDASIQKAENTGGSFALAGPRRVKSASTMGGSKNYVRKTTGPCNTGKKDITPEQTRLAKVRMLARRRELVAIQRQEEADAGLTAQISKLMESRWMGVKTVNKDILNFPNRTTWGVRCCEHGVSRTTFGFTDEIAAALASDVEQKRLGRWHNLNFPEEKDIPPGIEMSAEQLEKFDQATAEQKESHAVAVWNKGFKEGVWRQCEEAQETWLLEKGFFMHNGKTGALSAPGMLWDLRISDENGKYYPGANFRPDGYGKMHRALDRSFVQDVHKELDENDHVEAGNNYDRRRSQTMHTVTGRNPTYVGRVGGSANRDGGPTGKAVPAIFRKDYTGRQTVINLGEMQRRVKEDGEACVRRAWDIINVKNMGLEAPREICVHYSGVRQWRREDYTVVSDEPFQRPPGSYSF